MTKSPPSKPSHSTQSLRERKKAKTRTAIQQHAMQLFTQVGYDATTLAQIAKAADIAPSTIFLYFPTKEDIVLYDPIDLRVADAFAAQPTKLSLLVAFRRAVHDTLSRLSDDDYISIQERYKLIHAVSKLRAKNLDTFTDAFYPLTEVAAKRLGRSPEDIAVRSLVGAIMGAVLSVLTQSLTELATKEAYMSTLDTALCTLEQGFTVL